MTCPKCAGLLIHEENQEHSGRFCGWRCIQCGLRLDETIVHNRQEARSGAPPVDAHAAAGPYAANLPVRTPGRRGRPARAS